MILSFSGPGRGCNFATGKILTKNHIINGKIQPWFCLFHLHRVGAGRTAVRLRLGGDRRGETVLRGLFRHRRFSGTAGSGHEHSPCGMSCRRHAVGISRRPSGTQATAHHLGLHIPHLGLRDGRVRPLRGIPCDTFHRGHSHRHRVGLVADVYSRGGSVAYTRTPRLAQPAHHRARHTRGTDCQLSHSRADACGHHDTPRRLVECAVGVAVDVLERGLPRGAVPAAGVLHPRESALAHHERAQTSGRAHTHQYRRCGLCPQGD